MPKKSSSLSTASKKKEAKPTSSRSLKVEFSAEDLVLQANIALSSMQFELAVKFLKRALQMSPTDTGIMDSLAEVYMQLGESYDAINLFQQSISLEPTRNPYKWCYLAQLQCGEEALASYKKAIEIMSHYILTLPDQVFIYSVLL